MAGSKAIVTSQRMPGLLAGDWAAQLVPLHTQVSLRAVPLLLPPKSRSWEVAVS
jgi:hypothetical protein